MSKSIPVRSACDPQYQWTLTDIFPAMQTGTAAMPRSEILLILCAVTTDISLTVQTRCCPILELGDHLSRQLDALANYAQRKSDEDTRNAVYQEMTTQFTNLAVAVNQADAFSTPELLAIPDDVLHDFYTTCPKLTHYRLQLDRIRRQRAHTLSPECEALLPQVSSVRLLMKFFLCSMMQTCSSLTHSTKAGSHMQLHMVLSFPFCNRPTAYCAKMLFNRFTMYISSFETPPLQFRVADAAAAILCKCTPLRIRSARCAERH